MVGWLKELKGGEGFDGFVGRLKEHQIVNCKSSNNKWLNG